jgi:hypothetical protein
VRKYLYASLASLSLAAPLSAIDNKSHDSFPVSEHNGECAAGGQTILCSEIASLLENLGVRKDRLITVSASGLDQAAYERALNVAAMIRAGGWKNVAVVGMLTN